MIELLFGIGLFVLYMNFLYLHWIREDLKLIKLAMNIRGKTIYVPLEPQVPDERED